MDVLAHDQLSVDIHSKFDCMTEAKIQLYIIFSNERFISVTVFYFYTFNNVMQNKQQYQVVSTTL